eukprot:GHVS01023578.1.p1 GENE.GHVS01023578.1~~GHVS01023578.1.p1  ORF type:complete len:443 (-),score=18.09 GHVS01023578.1:244-1572(-)
MSVSFVVKTTPSQAMLDRWRRHGVVGCTQVIGKKRQNLLWSFSLSVCPMATTSNQTSLDRSEQDNKHEETIDVDVFCGDIFTFRAIAFVAMYLCLRYTGVLVLQYLEPRFGFVIPWSYFYFATFPPCAISAYWLRRFHKQVFLEQALYCSLTAFLLAFPLQFIVPVARMGSDILMRLLGMFLGPTATPWIMAPTFVAWSIFDSFILKAFLHESIKFIIVRRLLQRKQATDHRGLIAYGLVVAMTVAWVDSIFQAVYLRNVASVIDKQAAPRVLSSFSYYQPLYSFPMHAVSVFLMVSRLARRKFSNEAVTMSEVICVPVILHGVPMVATRLLKAAWLSQVNRVIASRPGPIEVDKSLVVRWVASRDLLQVISCLIMLTCLCIGLVLARRWYTRLAYVPALDVHKLREEGRIQEPSFLFSRHDFCLNETAADEEDMLLGQDVA